MTPDVLAQLIGDPGSAPAVWREGPWVAIGARARRALAEAPGNAVRRVLFARDVHGALEHLVLGAVAGCVVEAEALSNRPPAALRQLLGRVGRASVIVLGPVRDRRVARAVRDAGLVAVDPNAAPATPQAAVVRSEPRTGRDTLPRADGAQVPPPTTNRMAQPKRRGPSAGRFAAGCLERIARPAALRAYVLETFVRVSGAERGSLMLRELGRRTLRLAAAHGWNNPKLVGKVRVGLGSGVAGRAASLGRPITGHGAPGGSRRYAGSAYVVVPLGRGRRPEGVVSLTGLPGDTLPDTDTLRLWRRLARRAGTALEAAHRMRRAERLSARDALTGLPNRRAFERALGRELERARRGGTGLGVAMLDVDHFKAINDRLGHQVGDRVLVEVARRLDDAFRETDLVCRWGGEEFAVLLTGIAPDDPSEAEAAVDRSRRAVGERPFTIGSGVPAIRVTISAGFAAWPNAGTDETVLLRAADRALYRAKDSGRDRVCRA